MFEKLKRADVPQELVFGWPRSVLLGDEKLIVEQHQGVLTTVDKEGPGLTLRMELKIEGPAHG